MKREDFNKIVMENANQIDEGGHIGLFTLKNTEIYRKAFWKTLRDEALKLEVGESLNIDGLKFSTKRYKEKMVANFGNPKIISERIKIKTDTTSKFWE